VHKTTLTKVTISAVALILAVVTALPMSQAYLQLTPSVLILLGFAVVPWLADIVDSMEFPGGWKVSFQKLTDEQARQKDEIEALKFLVSGFVTGHELQHLEKLGNQDPFPFVQGPETSFFEGELRRLRALGLITGQLGKGIRTMRAQGGDVKDHFRITERGVEYLKLRRQVEMIED